MLKQIQKEISNYNDTDITIVDGLSFNQKRTIEKIYRYLNSKFLTGAVDIEGNKKYFFNIVNNPCRVETKSTDFDTKHIAVQTASGGDSYKTWFFERDLKFWFKDMNFGKVLNRIFDERPKFGTVVIKTIKGKPYFVDLRNFVVEQSADTLDNSNYIIEKHLYSPMEFRRVGKELGWDNIDEAIEQHRTMDKPYLSVYERYGEFGDKYDYQRIYIADVGVDTIDKYTHTEIPHRGVLLKQENIDAHPYTEFHRMKIPGRWLGVGVVELLFEPQIRENEIANLESKGDYYAALHVWQSSGEKVNINLNRDVVDGQVLDNGGEPINPVEMTERNLAYFRIATDKWMKNRDELTFSYDVIQGERLPAGTPLGSARLAAAMAGSHFDQLREDVALDVKEYLFKVIIPQFAKSNTAEHILRIAGEDLDKVRNMMINQKTRAALFSFLKRKVKLPTRVQYDIIKAGIEERVKQSKEILLTIPKEFYKNLKYKIDIIITGEQRDTSIWSQTMFAGLQAVTADPTLLTDPTKKKFFSKWLEAGGASIIDFEPDIQPQGIQSLMPARGAGGGVSRPAMMGGIAPAAERII